MKCADSTLRMIPTFPPDWAAERWRENSSGCFGNDVSQLNVNVKLIKRLRCMIWLADSVCLAWPEQEVTDWPINPVSCRRHLHQGDINSGWGRVSDGDGGRGGDWSADVEMSWCHGVVRSESLIKGSVRWFYTWRSFYSSVRPPPSVKAGVEFGRRGWLNRQWGFNKIHCPVASWET